MSSLKLKTYHYVGKAAALFGMHATRLAKHPSKTMLGLVGRPFDLILDVGANVGQFAKEARAKFPAAHIVSFEPLPGPYAELAAWAKADGNARAVNCALGAADSVLPINLHVAHSASSSLLATHADGVERYPQMAEQVQIEVPVRRLDDVLAELDCAITPATLVKLDVQGFEELVLSGAGNTLRRAGALLTEVSLDAMYEGQAEFYALCRLAEAAGLRYAGNYAQFLAEDGHVIFLDALFVR